MFKIIILQALYNLSDDEIEFQLNDSISFMRFCGIETYDIIPDATIIWQFKESLGEEGSRELFELFVQQMVEAGLQFLYAYDREGFVHSMMYSAVRVP